MTSQVLFDKLAYIDRLTRAGIADEQARAHAEAMDEALRESVVTKSDLTSAVSSLEAKIEIAVRDMKIWTGGILVAGLGLLFTALHYWPPHA
jgi:hypothetical protein